MAEFEIKYAKRVDEDAKLLALKSIMVSPETLFGEAGVFRGRSFSTPKGYAELRTSIIPRYLDDKVPVSMMTKSSSSSVTTSFVQNLIEGERENEEEDKDSITQEELFAMVQQFRKGKGKGKSKGKGKGVCWNCGDGDHYSRDCPNDKQDSWTETMSWKGQQDSRISKGSSKGWDTGKSNWNSAKGKGKEWQPYGKWSSTKGKFGSKGKGSIYSVDGITESDGWTQSDVANSEEDSHFCIMEHSQDVVTDDITNRVGATGAVKLGDEHEWRNGHFKNYLKKQRQDHCIPLRNKFQMLGILESERSDDDEMEAPIYVFDDNENGRWIKEEAVVDSGAVECVTSRNRVPHLKVEETPESRRGETWTCAGGKEIKKEGKVTIHWTTESGVSKKGVFKVGAVSRTLISVDRLQETGHDVILTKNRPRIINMKTGEVMPLRKNRGMFILDMWIWIPTSQSKIEECSDFVRQR